MINFDEELLKYIDISDPNEELREKYDELDQDIENKSILKYVKKYYGEKNNVIYLLIEDDYLISVMSVHNLLYHNENFKDVLLGVEKFIELYGINILKMCEF